MQSSGQSTKGSHRIDDWRCQRLFAYRHPLKLQPIQEPAPRARGSMLHLGAMHYWNTRLGVPGAQDPIQALRRAPARIAYTIAEIEAPFRAWMAHHDKATPDPRKSILAVEEEFAIFDPSYRDGSEPLHTQRMDRIEAVGDSEFDIVDMKTTSRDSLPRQIAAEYENKTQFVSMLVMGLTSVAETLGRRLRNIVVEVINLRPPYPVTRVVVHPLPALIDPWLVMIREKNQEIDAAKESGRDPWDYRMDLSQCDGRWGRCEYWGLCTRGKSALGEFVTAVDEATFIEAK